MRVFEHAPLPTAGSRRPAVDRFRACWKSRFPCYRGEKLRCGRLLRKSSRKCSLIQVFRRITHAACNSLAALTGFAFTKNRITCQIENSLYLDRCSAMNESSTKLHRKIRRTAGRVPSEAAECGPTASKMRPKRGGRRRKNLEGIKDVWKACNPLKSHKTAKDFFGKAWSKNT
jgi:hypothetical protein